MEPTRPQVLVATELLSSEEPLSGYDLKKRTGVALNVLYPMLTRMRADALVIDEWAESRRRHGPARRVHSLTADGRRECERIIDLGREVKS